MLVNTYSKRIFNMAYQFSGSRQEAEDLTQDIFLKLFHSLRKYDFEKNFTAWLLTLTKNYLIDTYRRTKWEKVKRDKFTDHYATSDIEHSPDDVLIREENRKAVWESLNFLNPDIRTAVILREIQGRKYEEVAEIMNLPLGTVKSRVNRGKLQLAKILQEKKERTDDL